VSPISLPLPPATETTLSGPTVVPVEHGSGGLGSWLSEGDRLGTSLGFFDMDGLKVGTFDGNKLAEGWGVPGVGRLLGIVDMDGLKVGTFDGNKLAEG